MQWYRKQPKCRAEDCSSIQAAHYYCRPHEQLALTTRTLAMQQKTLQRFRRAIEPDWGTGCWMWQERANEDGYGQFHAGGAWLAHRFSYVWFCGGHERGKVLDHLCNRPLCVRPDHMLPMTNTNNSSLRQERAFAVEREFFRAARITPRYLSVIKWAVDNDLPSGKPARPSDAKRMPEK